MFDSIITSFVELNKGKDLNLMETDLLIIGGGVAALSAAVSAVKNGIENVFIIEKDKKAKKTE